MVGQKIQYEKLPFSFQACTFFLKLNIDLFLKVSLRLDYDKSVMMLSLLAEFSPLFFHLSEFYFQKAERPKD